MAQRRPNTPSSIIYMFVAVWRARRLPFYVFPLCLNGHASGSHCVEMALVRCGWGASLRLDEDIKRPGSGVRAIRVSGGGWGPALRTSRDQRMRLAPAMSATAQAAAKVLAEAG